jgi:Predicted nucleic-acid-binding protein containing a Zn-ribbon
MANAMTSKLPKPQPRVTELTRPFWEGANAGELIIQRCADPACAKAVFYPRVCCPYCKGPKLDWFRALGTGRIISHTTIFRTHHDGFNSEVPYVFAAVQLTEGPCIYAQIPGAPIDGRSLTNESVTVDFIEHGAGREMPVFRLARTMPNATGS